MAWTLRNHLEVSSLVCLIVDTGYWLGCQLGSWPEHWHIASPRGRFVWASLDFLTESQLSSKSKCPKTARWKLALKDFWHYFHQSYTIPLRFKRWEYEPHLLIEGMSESHNNSSFWDGRYCWQHHWKTLSSILRFSSTDKVADDLLKKRSDFQTWRSEDLVMFKQL